MTSDLQRKSRYLLRFIAVYIRKYVSEVVFTLHVQIIVRRLHRAVSEK